MMFIIKTVDGDQYGCINYMEYDFLRKQMMKPTPTQNYIYIKNTIDIKYNYKTTYSKLL